MTWNLGFPYEPVDNDKGEIRLLTILPKSLCNNDSSQSQPGRIICFLDRATLSSVPRYTALSYTWGSPIDPETIEVNGVEFTVTQSLAGLLRHLQQGNEEVTVWADAICIQQSDLAEKSGQIAHMLDIYRQAHTTVIWLGPEQNDSDSVMERLRQISKEPDALKLAETPFQDALRYELEATKNLGKIAWARTKSIVLNGDISSMADDELEDTITFSLNFCLLMNREYWTRVWCLQELVTSGNTLVSCGEHIMDVDEFAVAAKACGRLLVQLRSDAMKNLKAPEDMSRMIQDPYLERTKAYNMLRYRQDYLNTRGEQQEGRDSPFTLASLLFNQYLHDGVSNLESLQASVPHDRIYGLLGLADDRRNLNITPQYDLSWEKVYTDAMYRLLRAGHWELLLLCQDTVDRVTDPAMEILPSWVPDWQQELRQPPSRPFDLDHPFSAGGDPGSSWLEFGNDRVLSVKGTIVTEIKEVGNLFSSLGVKSITVYLDICYKFLSQLQEFWKKSTQSREANPMWKAGSAAENSIARIAVGDIEPKVGDNGGSDCERAGEQTLLKFRKALRECHSGARGQRMFSTTRDDGQPTIVGRLFKRFDIDEDALNWGDIYYSAAALASRSFRSIDEWVVYVGAMTKNHDRRPFLCADGRIGIGPKGVSVGDKVVLVSGTGVPFVLKAESLGHENYKLLGEAYVHGIMDGEFLHQPRAHQMFNIV